MKQLPTVCAAMLVAGVAYGQVLECVDAKGNREFAQICPPGTVKETVLMKNRPGAPSPGAPAAGPAAKSPAEREAEFRKRNLERQEAEAKEEKAKAGAIEAARHCSNARSRLKTLQDGMRILRADPNTGERSYLPDQDRPREISDAQQAVDSWCNR